MFRGRNSVFRHQHSLFENSQSVKISTKNRIYSSPAFCLSFSSFLNVAGVGGLFKPLLHTQPHRHPDSTSPAPPPVSERATTHPTSSVPATQSPTHFPRLPPASSPTNTEHRERKTGTAVGLFVFLVLFVVVFCFLDARSLGHHGPG